MSSSLKNETGSIQSIVRFPMSSSLRNETRFGRSIVHFPMSSSLKNETGSRYWSSIVPDLVSSSLKNETRVMRIVLLLCEPHQKMKQLPFQIESLIKIS